MTAPVHLTVAPTDDAAGALVAERILDRLAERGSLRLGCPAGRTPTSTYRALGRLAGERGVDLSGLTIVMMDEYAPPRGPFSCHRYADEVLVPALGGPARRGTGLRADAVRWPDPRDPLAYEREIAALGGIDVFLVASGASDGHVGFNPPGSPLDSRTRVVELSEPTRLDNLDTFAGSTLADVPDRGVTVGLATICDAREAVLVLLGASKRSAFERVMRTDDYDASWPATVIHRCQRPWVVADDAAVGSYDAVRGG